MADTQNNTNTQTQNNNQNQSGENNQAQQNSNTNQGTQTQNNTPSVDVEAEKKKAVNDLLKKLGYGDEESLNTDITEYKKYLDSQKTAQEKVQGTLDETTKQLAEEREARIVAEAKVEAMKLGVKEGLVDDVVLIAKNRVTKDKDIVAVLTEMKDNADEKIYFKSEEEGGQSNNNNAGTNNNTQKNVTRKSVNNNSKQNNNNNSGDNNGDGKYAGTMAARLLGGVKKAKETSGSYYFGKHNK